MDLTLGHRVFIPKHSFWAFNGNWFEADGTAFFEFVPEANPGADPWTLSLAEVVQLTR